MKLKNRKTYWQLKKTKVEKIFLKDISDTECDILIIGGGISGALIANDLIGSDLKIYLVDKGKIASQSTSASTALITYELDTPLVELQKEKGKDATKIYKLTFDAINKLRSIAESYGERVEKLDTESVYLADSSEGFEVLKKEYKLRVENGYEVSLKNSEELLKDYGLNAKGALISRGNYVLNPVNLTELILSNFNKKHKVYEETEIIDFKSNKAGVLLTTNSGSKIQAKKVVWVTGYAALEMVKEDKINLLSTFVCVTEPFKNNPLKGLQIWQYKDPYIYTRTTPDGRIIIGGEDIKIVNTFIRERLVGYKVKRLLKKLEKIRPDLVLKPEYTWVATFAESEDSLPYFGEIDKYPNCFFVIPCGGNGITFSTLAGEIVKDWIEEKENAHVRLFGFGR